MSFEENYAWVHTHVGIREGDEQKSEKVSSNRRYELNIRRVQFV